MFSEMNLFGLATLVLGYIDKESDFFGFVLQGSGSSLLFVFKLWKASDLFSVSQLIKRLRHD